MKKLLLIFSISIIAFGCNSEQKRIDKMATKMVNNINAVCQLTPDQQSKVKDAAMVFAKAKIDNADKYAQNQETLINQNAAAKNDYIFKLKSILTTDQVEKLKASRQQHKEGQPDKESE